MIIKIVTRTKYIKQSERLSCKSLTESGHSRLRGNDDPQGFIQYFYDYVFYGFVRPHQNI